MKTTELKRTHYCGELSAADVGKHATLMGWVSTRRDHGGVIFVDLRDRSGITQIVFNPESNNNFHKEAEVLKREDVIAVSGKVRKRDKELINPNIPTGEIEVVVEDMRVITTAITPPIEIEDRKEANEDLRLKYRYLDLRRPVMQRNIHFRHELALETRNYFAKHGFIEIETPLLVKATPEGARDYLVPSRVNPGKFYALPQSPQLYKQILMISGFDKYFQIARCLRDEDLRADRQPEFTQIDLEMSFVSEKEIMGFVESYFKHVFKTQLGLKLKDKFKVILYKDAMAKYGCDKPDLRFGLELKDVTAIVAKSDYTVFKDVIAKGGIVKCVNPTRDFQRSELDECIEFARECGAKGLSWMKVTQDGLDSNIVKYFSAEIQKELIKATGAKPGSVLMFVADKEKKTNEVLAKLRLNLGKTLKLIDPKAFVFCWIVDFPLFEWDENIQNWTPAHHMFTMPKTDTLEFLEKEPGNVIGNLYDIVLNGVELGSGSIRIHDPKLQERVMKVIGLSHEEAHHKFGFLLDAYKYGSPVHGGMGLGLDRIAAMMLGYTDIREVIAFPKNKSAQCPMDSSPSDVEKEQLKELHLRVDVVSKETAKDSSKEK